MMTMVLCPKCGSVASFNSYFGAYICEKCEWMDKTFDDERIEKYHSLTTDHDVCTA